MAVSAKALAVLLVLLLSRRKRERDIVTTAKVSSKRLVTLTGYHPNTILIALHELEAKKFISRLPDQRKRHGEFSVSEYALCNPATGEELPNSGSKSPYYHAGIRYFLAPKDVVMRAEEHWSLAKMTSSELAIYASTLFVANSQQKNTNVVLRSSGELRKISKLSSDTFQSARRSLEAKGLISMGLETFNIHDPFSGLPIEHTANPADDPANYVAAAAGRRLNFNMLPGELEQMLLSFLPPDSRVVHQTNGDITIKCPFHEDRNPSCSVSTKNKCFYCFGCGHKGFIGQLLQQLNGAAVKYHAPDNDAIAIYDYRDKNGKPLKQVVRHKDKKFTQRKCPGVWNVKGVPPSLYNRELLDYHHTIAIVEGEKDCNTLNALKVHDVGGAQVLAVTSGGSDSWVDKLADDLTGKRVAIISDTDEAGRAYARQVQQSLEKRDIEHRVIDLPCAKDVTEYLQEGGTPSDLARLIGSDWVIAPDAVTFGEYQPVTA